MVLARIDLHTRYDTQGDTVETQFLFDSDKIIRGSQTKKQSELRTIRESNRGDSHAKVVTKSHSRE